MKQPLFYQRHKQGTGLSRNLDIRPQLLDLLGVNTASDGAFRGNDADLAIPRYLHRSSGSCADHANDGNVKFFFYRCQGISACRIAGNHNRFDMLRHQKADDLSGVADDGVLGFASIRNPRRISKIDDPFFWHLPHDLSGYGQAADAGIENADRGILIRLLVKLRLLITHHNAPLRG